jgi:hypothetical protein
MKASNLTQRQNLVSPTETETFAYDHLDRLTGVTGAYSESYGYNQIGNLTSKNGTNNLYGNGYTSGLSGSWNLDEGSGTTAMDTSGTGNYGTLMNSPSWVSGKKGQAVNFNGTNNYIALSQQPPLASGFTFSAWVKRSADQVGEIFNNNQFFHLISRSLNPGGEGESAGKWRLLT